MHKTMAVSPEAAIVLYYAITSYVGSDCTSLFQ